MTTPVGDAREVVSDPEAHIGADGVEERSLVPVDEVRFRRISFGEWLAARRQQPDPLATVAVQVFGRRRHERCRALRRPASKKRQGTK